MHLRVCFCRRIYAFLFFRCCFALECSQLTFFRVMEFTLGYVFRIDKVRALCHSIQFGLMVKSGCEVHFAGPDGLYLYTSYVQVVLT